IIALLFAPLYRWLLPRVRQRRTPAALLTVVCAVLIVILPFTILSATLAREAMQIPQAQSGAWDATRFFHRLFDALPAWSVAVLDRFHLANFGILQQELTAALALFSRFVASHAIDIGQETVSFVAELFVTVYLDFFMLRDGDSI